MCATSLGLFFDRLLQFALKAKDAAFHHIAVREFREHAGALWIQEVLEFTKTTLRQSRGGKHVANLLDCFNSIR